MGLQCISGSCAPYGAVGAACDSVRRCLNDLICNAANVCAAKGAAGTACTSSGGECRAENFCNVPTGQTNGTCTARRTLDQTCTGFFQCAPPLYCTGTASVPGVCKPYGTLGATCTFTGQYGQCGTLESGLYCTATQAAPMGVCANKKSTGATCTRFEECRNNCLNGVCTAPSICVDETP